MRPIATCARCLCSSLRRWGRTASGADQRASALLQPGEQRPPSLIEFCRPSIGPLDVNMGEMSLRRSGFSAFYKNPEVICHDRIAYPGYATNNLHPQGKADLT